MPPQASGHIVVIFVLKIKAHTSRRENIALEFKLPRGNSRKFELFLFRIRILFISFASYVASVKTRYITCLNSTL